MSIDIEKELDKFQRQKRKRVAFVLDELLKRGGRADKKEFEGSICSTYGIRRETLEDEYFTDLQYYGAIDVTQDEVILKWDKEKTEEWVKRQMRR